MNLSSTIKNYPLFNQEEYDNTFYYCDNDHPFVAFTTCYCPICDNETSIRVLRQTIDQMDKRLDDYEENYYKLVVKVKNSAPELLV